MTRRSDGLPSDCSKSAFSDEGKALEKDLVSSLGSSVEKGLEEAEISLPPEQRKKVSLVVERVIEQSQYFSGPQPSPAMLEGIRAGLPRLSQETSRNGIRRTEPPASVRRTGPRPGRPLDRLGKPGSNVRNGWFSVRLCGSSHGPWSWCVFLDNRSRQSGKRLSWSGFTRRRSACICEWSNAKAQPRSGGRFSRS